MNNKSELVELNEYVQELECRIDELKKENADLKKYVSSLENDVLYLEYKLEEKAQDFISVDLGLDTLTYKLEKGNLRIQQKLDEFIELCRE